MIANTSLEAPSSPVVAFEFINMDYPTNKCKRCNLEYWACLCGHEDTVV